MKRERSVVHSMMIGILLPALAILLATVGCSSTKAGVAGVDPIEKGFMQPPDNARIMMRWWWYGLR